MQRASINMPLHGSAEETGGCKTPITFKSSRVTTAIFLRRCYFPPEFLNMVLSTWEFGAWKFTVLNNISLEKGSVSCPDHVSYTPMFLPIR